MLMDSLMKMSEKAMDTNVSHAFMGRVKTEEENTRKCCQDKQTVKNNKL